MMDMDAHTIEGRPQETREIRGQAAAEVVDELMKAGLLVEIEREEAIADIAQEGSRGLDGYELASALERYHRWSPDMQMAEILDGYAATLDKVLETARRKWVDENNIQPSLAVGTRVRFGRNNETGTIDGVYEHMAACYKVKADNDERENCWRIVKFEDAQEVSA